MVPGLPLLSRFPPTLSLSANGHCCSARRRSTASGGRARSSRLPCLLRRPAGGLVSFLILLCPMLLGRSLSLAPAATTAAALSRSSLPRESASGAATAPLLSRCEIVAPSLRSRAPAVMPPGLCLRVRSASSAPSAEPVRRPLISQQRFHFAFVRSLCSLGGNAPRRTSFVGTPRRLPHCGKDGFRRLRSHSLRSAAEAIARNRRLNARPAAPVARGRCLSKPQKPS